MLIRYAQSDDEVVAIHRFLCVVAGPMLPGPIAPKESIEEIWRVVNHEAALMAMDEEILVGTFGLVSATYWWNHRLSYLANRWFFALPGRGAGRLLLREAIAIAKASDRELQIFDETKSRYRIFNRDARRQAAGPAFTPTVAVVQHEQPSAPTLQ